MVQRTSIAVRLFVLVFGFSVAWFTLTTAVQMVIEYRNTRMEVDSNLTDLFYATRSGLESALWNYDLLLVRGSLEASRPVRFLSGAVVRDENGTVMANWGQSGPSGRGLAPGEEANVAALAEPLVHHFLLEHSDGHGNHRVVGELTLVSDLHILQHRLADRFWLIVSNYLESTLGLMVILLLGLQRLVGLPLGRITRAIGDYRFDRSGLPPLDKPLKNPDELSVLWKSFESLTTVLKESYLQQRVLSAILEEAAVMALVCDADGRVVSSNAQARVRLSGGQPGGDLARLSYGEGGTPLLKEVAVLLSAGLAWRGEVEISNGQNQTFWLATALLPLEVADEPRARWGVMIEDVSAKKLTELYRRERDLAQEATRAKSLFLANLSHEIRTPMNAVVGLTALALDEEVSPRAREYLAQLERSGAALLGVINDILDYSKLEEGKLELESRDFPLASLLGAVEAMARFRAEEKGLEFSIEASPKIPGILRGDALRLQQVLLNLVSNAVKFTAQGRVEVRVFPVGDPVHLRFEVRDTGIGIARDDQNRLFQSFTQVDASTTRQYGGTGLGLAISRQLVVLMGGSLGLESSPGMGSLFWFEVGLAAGTPVTEPATPIWDLAKLRVLLAEDNKVNQLVAREILGKVGIRLVVVSDGKQAVERVAAEEFDLVLMDLQMPVMDGLEAVRQIRKTKDAETLPILAMTAHTFAQERETCLAAGMQDLVPKPVDPSALFMALSRWRPGGPRS